MQISQEAPEHISFEDYKAIVDAYIIASEEIFKEAEDRENKYVGPPTKNIVISAVTCLAKDGLFKEADEYYFNHYTEGPNDEGIYGVRYEFLENYIESGNYGDWYGVNQSLSFANFCWAEESGDYNWNGDTYFDIVNSPQVSVLGYTGENSMYVNTTSKFIKRGDNEVYELVFDYFQSEIWDVGLEEEAHAHS